MLLVQFNIQFSQFSQFSSCLVQYTFTYSDHRNTEVHVAQVFFLQKTNRKLAFILGILTPLTLKSKRTNDKGKMNLKTHNTKYPKSYFWCTNSNLFPQSVKPGFSCNCFFKSLKADFIFGMPNPLLLTNIKIIQKTIILSKVLWHFLCNWHTQYTHFDSLMQ